MGEESKITSLYPNAEMDTVNVEKLSKAHADWVCKILNYVATDFGVHMYGHGFIEGKIQGMRGNIIMGKCKLAKCAYPLGSCHLCPHLIKGDD